MAPSMSPARYGGTFSASGRKSKTAWPSPRKHYGDKVVSVGVDTWGVDFVLLTKNGELLGQPYHYRDGRVAGML